MSQGLGRSFPFSRFGLRLFAFWVLAMTLFAVGWAWRPAGLNRTVSDPPPQTAAAQKQVRKPKPVSNTLLERLFVDRDDSWAAMRAALEQKREHPSEPLYAGVLAQCLKFQYPPSSLLAIDAAGSLFGAGVVSNPVLNVLSLVFLAAFLAATYLLAKPALPPLRTAPLDHALILLLGLTYYPTLKGLELGQIQTWLSALFALALLSYVRGHRVWVGIALGVIVSIKPQMGVFLLWALLRRELRLAAAMAATLATLGLLSLARYGLDAHLEYLKLLPLLSRGEAYAPNQSLNGLLLRALHLGANRSFSCQEFGPEHPLVHFGTLAGTLGLMGFALFYKPGWHRNNPGASMGLAAVCFTLASPIAWEHHYGIMPPIFAVCLAALALGQGRTQRWQWFALGTAWLLSVRFAAVGVLADTAANFLQSYLFFGGLTLIVVLHTLRRPKSPEAPA
jgi:Glycosyltransferase family 87